MSQNLQADGGQKHLAVGRGLLAAAETLNFSMNQQRSSQQVGSLHSGAGSGMEGQGNQMAQRGSGGNLGSTMKLFASLGLSPSDLDALADIPEEDISVETLPQILMKLKNRKGDTGERQGASSVSSDNAYRGGRDSWGDMHVGRLGGPSLGQSSARSQPPADLRYSSLEDVAPNRGYGFGYSSNSSGGGSRERPYSEPPHRDSYSGLGSMGPPTSDPIFMQRRMGSPSTGKVQDFLGVMPTMFPHVCSLCDFDVHSTMEWNQHLNGLKHGENRRRLLDMYPEWDPAMSSGRGGGRLDTPNLSAGLLGPPPRSGGMSSGWGGGGGPGLSGQSQLRTRVVVVKYDRKPLSNKTLFAFTKPFGRLREHLILKNKAFLEMCSHEEALDMVNYYNQHPATLYGKPISFYLSRTLLVIEKDERSAERPTERPMRDTSGESSKVVFFSKLPKEESKKRELLTIAGRFGTVEKHVFLNDQAFIQLGTPEDAEMLVKYYTMNPLTIRGRLIHLNICTKYKTLTVNRRRGGSDGDKNRRGREVSTTSTSSHRSSFSKSPSSSRSREEKKEEVEEEEEEKKNKMKSEEKPAEDNEEEEEGEPGVMAEEDGEEQEVMDGDTEVLKPERGQEEETAGESKDLTPKVPDDDDATDDAPEGVKKPDEEAKQVAESEGHTETEEEKKDEKTEAAETVEGEDTADECDYDFLENMEDFVTLDELDEDEDDTDRQSDSLDNTRRGGMRVVNIVGFKRGYNFLNELLGLAKPFGKVVKHLVLDLRPEAYLQFDTEQEARSMAKFYNSNITASVCGRAVRISHSMSYPTIQCGSSKVVYIGQIPNTKYSDEAILKLAEPFGPVWRYFTNMIKRECFLEMMNAEDAEKMAEHYKVNPPKMQGKRLTVYVSRKYRQLKHGHRCPTVTKRDKSSISPKSSKHSEEPPSKKSKEEKHEDEGVEVEKHEESQEKKQEEQHEETKEDKEEEHGEDMQSGDVGERGEEKETCENDSVPEKEMGELSEINQEENEEIPEDSEKTSGQEEERHEEHEEEEMETTTNQITETEETPPTDDNKSSPASLALPSYDSNIPAGVEYVKAGFYCRICFLFYSNEETAKKTHCSSRAHYDKLRKHLEKEESQAKNKGKTTTT